MRLPRQTKRAPQESTITLINVVFLMLIFFLIAGSLTPPLDKDVTLISTAESDRAEPPEALFVTSDGVMRTRGEETDAAGYVAHVRQEQALLEDDPVAVKLAADRDLPATRLIEIVGELKSAGANRVTVVTERGKP
ncbi:ExbD/TolR family protein [Mesorhizobium xinjiangense]|uniref:ExbD/TolR family protein n=1 Tax=Mesorhizobium xinjiangense TaxID=2678685 RepID=UPI0012ED7441|nr:biopolymer transporter ExbD [Mesorhizobium xinjiangense]